MVHVYKDLFIRINGFTGLAISSGRQPLLQAVAVHYMYILPLKYNFAKCVFILCHPERSKIMIVILKSNVHILFGFPIFGF
jgi:hypothetical protein